MTPSSTTNVLDGLGVTPAADNATDTGATPPAEPDATYKPLLVLRAISAGQIPGVAIPSNAPKITSDLTPDDITGAGVGIYRPHTSDLAAILFNQEQVPVKTLENMDKAGKLSEAFPSIMTFLGGPGTPKADADSSTGPAPVPVMPAPTFGARASTKVATARVNALGGTAPSDRIRPGGGTVLNGLLQRPV